jgi:uncharacterized protein (TIGR02217 family)
MPLAILDDRLALGFTGGPTYRTSVLAMAGGKERRNATWPLPRRLYEFSYNVRPIEDCWAIEDFFHDVDGRGQVWLLPDFTLARNKTHILGTGDGVETEFQARIGYGSSSIRYVDATYIVPGTLTVYVNGVAATVASEADGLITMSSPPANASVVTASFRPLIPVRFEQDDIKIQVSFPEDVGQGQVLRLSAVEVR